MRAICRAAILNGGGQFPGRRNFEPVRYNSEIASRVWSGIDSAELEGSMSVTATCRRHQGEGVVYSDCLSVGLYN